jgi:hypothetical protein
MDDPRSELCRMEITSVRRLGYVYGILNATVMLQSLPEGDATAAIMGAFTSGLLIFRAMASRKKGYTL